MKTFFLLLILFAISLQNKAQVTIGSGTPPIESSLLQLKQRESTDSDLTNADKGISFPRVALTKVNELYPMYGLGYPSVVDVDVEKKANIGLVVYNITDSGNPDPGVDSFVRGLYVWDGAFWNLFQSNRIIDPSIDELMCGSASLVPAAYTAGTEYKGVLKVPYNGGNGGFYDSAESVTVNNLKFTLQAGKLNIGSGEILYAVEGIPFVSSPEITMVPINLLGQTCIVSVGNTQEVKTISFAKTTAEQVTTDNVASKTATILGNISVRIEYLQYSGFPSYGYSYFLTYKVAVPNHVTILYSKSGRSVGYVVTGRKAAKDINSWYRVKTGAFNDNDLILDENATAGPSGNKDDLNPENRDIVEAIFMLHNTNEVYRVTINSNGSIPADGLISAISPTITLFIEKLD